MGPKPGCQRHKTGHEQQQIHHGGEALPEGALLAARDDIVDALKTVSDPEIPINIYDMGFVYDIRQLNNGNVEIDMTLTAPTLCSRAGAFSTEHWLQPFRPDSKRSALLRICRMSCRPGTADSRSVRLGSRPSLWLRAEPSILTFKIKPCSITQETPAAAKVQLPRQLRPASDAAAIELFSFKRI